MHKTFRGWDEVAAHLKAFAAAQKVLETGGGTASRLNHGQQSALLALAQRLPHNGVVIADEVGMGKTRIAVETARAVIAAGGRVTVLAPPGLGYQWRDELRDGEVDSPPIIRSLKNYFEPWEKQEEKDPEGGEAMQVEPALWFSQPLLIVSHAFTNWRLSKSPASWRWSLLPELYAQWRKRTTGRMPRTYFREEEWRNPFVSSAANSICAAIPDDPSNIAWQQCDALSEKTPWPAATQREQYGRNENLRPWLECAVGLGLGVFDLIIVDEAHKSRGAESGLSVLLGSVIQRSPSAKVLAMTATPVELEVSQWQNTLARIGIDTKSTPALTTAIEAYAKAVKTVRLSPGNAEIRDAFAAAAKAFQSALSPYLLRRDKRQDQAVLAFVSHSGKSANDYRHEKDITVETAKLTPAWRKAVCAAEALSFVSRNLEDRQSQRIRLTLGNGHGIAALLNRRQDIDHLDVSQEESDAEQEESLQPVSKASALTISTDPSEQSSKQAQRVRWWRSALGQAFTEDDDNLFGHPAILACVKEIEDLTTSGEKVLVFGRFTQPLRALVSLLNAREMVRCLQVRRPWPQGKIHEPGAAASASEDERPAVRAALRQLQSPLSLSQVNDLLGQQYRDLENTRERWRTSLIDHLEAGLGMAGIAAETERLSKIQRLFFAFKESATKPASDITETSDATHILAMVGKAMLELMDDGPNASPAEFAMAFEQLINALTDRNEGDQDGDGVMNSREALELWPTLEVRLREEYDRPQGGFARLMIGATSPSTRRMLQLAFNRAQSFPKVLVAQSMVGREGLNLHKACSTVILLHPEWNPGVVEQQIGRVDRVGSHWARLLEKAIADNVAADKLPRINIRPVIFTGTYDGHHWKILRERWDDLRAQLHGVVIPPRTCIGDPELQRLAQELENLAPNFSPDR